MLKFTRKGREKTLAALQAKEEKLEVCLKNLETKALNLQADKNTFSTLIVACRKEIEILKKEKNKIAKSLANSYKSYKKNGTVESPVSDAELKKISF
ncbi:MAG: hypothetical protein REH83_02965 [Rickettsiella sp.]|nr:hypothetical protein [Rickettsiella sp.]